MTYREKLLDPRWQKKRLEVFQQAGFKCEACGHADRTLHVHHLVYSKGEPWEAPDATLECLCEVCHTWREEFNELFGRGKMTTRLCQKFVKVQAEFKAMGEDLRLARDELRLAREIGGATED